MAAIALTGLLAAGCSGPQRTGSHAGISQAIGRLAPSADASVSAARPRARHGKSRRLTVDRAPITRAYLRFDARHVTGRVTRATLRLYAITGSKAGYRVRGVAGRRWRESRLTYANAPRVSRRVAARSGPVHARTWTRVNVTSLIRSGRRVTLALTTPGKRALRVASRESHRKPRLVIRTAAGDVAAPTGVAVSATTTSITVRWRPGAGAGARGYELFLNGTPGPRTAATAYTFSNLRCGTSYTVGVRSDGHASRRSRLVSLTATTGACAGGTHVITAAGDYASGGSDAESMAVRNQVIAAHPEVHLGLGDYNYNDISTILTGFDKIWGPEPGGVFRLFRPTAGPTHDVTSCTSTGYQNYWGRPSMKGYSFDIGSWHIIQLPSAAYRYGCDTAGVLSWLRADLAASTAPCTLAYWHEPYWTNPTSEHTRTTAVKPWVQALYDAGAELILNGHQHDYQRFAPQAPNDHVDTARGLREFIVGTGGIGLYGFTGTAANIEAQNDTTWGALKLTLGEHGYSWQFLRAAGGTFSDSGSGTCH